MVLCSKDCVICSYVNIIEIFFQIFKLWNIIENEKITGCNHRAPKRNIKNTNTNTTSPGPERRSKCLINIDNLLNNNAESKNNIIISNQSQDNNGKDIVFNINTEILSETKLDS